jgi:hypothetical protein
MICGSRFVQCVPVRASPVAVRVAVYAWSTTRARDEVCGVGQGMFEVGVVIWRVCLGLGDRIVGRP